MTSDMLKFLTKKLKSQSLSEGQSDNDPEDADDEERDSGTESDENFEDDNPYGSDSSLNDLANENNNNITGNSVNVAGTGGTPGAKTHEISEHNFDTVSCTSDYERQSLDFDRHSSEDELVTINKENVAEKRKWSQVHCGCCDSSSDDEIKEFLLNPQPVLLSATPPKGVHRVKVYTRLPSQRQVLARMAPVTVTSVSPRKRHRHATSENVYETESGALTQRPCLDFEKMQQKTVKTQCSYDFSRTTLVKIRTDNGASRQSKCIDPAVFSFRSLTSTFRQLTPVEGPPCVY